MSEKVVVERYIAIDHKGNWSYHHGSQIVEYGYRAQKSAQEYLVDLMATYGEKPTHVLMWNPDDQRNAYTLREWNDGDGPDKTWVGPKLTIYTAADNTFSIEVHS